MEQYKIEFSFPLACHLECYNIFIKKTLAYATPSCSTLESLIIYVICAIHLSMYVYMLVQLNCNPLNKI